MTVPIRVLHALTSGGVGGTESSVWNLIPRLREHEIECEVGFLEPTGPTYERFVSSQLPVHDLSGGVPRAIGRLRKLISAREFDIVHAYGLRASIIARLAVHSIRVGRPFLVHGIRGLHVTEGEDPNGIRTQCALLIERALCPMVDAYLANSLSAVHFLVQKGLPSRKFQVIPNGIDSTGWRLRETQPAGACPTIVSVANFRPRKRHEDLVRAARVMADLGVEFRCVLIGDGPTRSAIAALVQSLNLEAHVELPGSMSTERIREILGRASVFSLVSLWEGMPVAVLEAMACGLPVVATDVPGTREIVFHRDTGLLVPVCSPDALAACLTELVKSPRLGLEMGYRGRERVERDFSLSLAAARHRTAYARLISSRQATSMPN